MATFSAAGQTALSETKYVKEFTLAGASIFAKSVLQETTGTYNAKVQAKRYALARKILSMSTEDDDTQVLSALARMIMNEVDQVYFQVNYDPQQLSNDISNDPVRWNTIAGVTGDDFI